MLFHKALLCTLGPSSMHAKVIHELAAAGVTSFRINMSHTAVDDLERQLRFVRDHTTVPICLDTEGAQVRTGAVGDGVTLVEGRSVTLVPSGAEGDAERLPISPPAIVSQLKPGTRMSVDFDSVLLRVDRVSGDSAEATVVVGGEVGSRKAITAFPRPPLPTLSPKDLLALDVAKRLDIHEFALSFCERPDSVSQLRERIGPDDTIMAKVESREGVRNLTEIARAADRIIVDRGDLSREVRVEAIPLLQKAIIRKANALGTPVYVATNLLESMVTRRTPTRAEVNDVINTLLDGADGLVLASETAVGKYPVEAAQMIASLLKEYEGSIEGYHIDDLLGDHPLSRR